MIKSKGILTISIISLFAVESAYASIASSGYVDQQVGTKISEVHATKTGTGNVVSSISAEGNTVTANKDIDAEVTDNKVTTIRTDGTATDVAYPSEKAVATALDAKQDKLEGEVLTNTATGNSATAINADDAAGVSSVALGSGASVGQNGAGGTAIGPEATVEAAAGTALGATSKVTAEHAIQLGAGTNSEANTLSVGFDEENNYKLLGIDGKIPAERLPFEGYVLTNNAMRPGSLSTGGAFAASTDGAVSIGPGSAVGAGSVAVGNNARAANNAVLIGSGSSMHNNVVIGVDAYGMADNAVSIGSSANADESSVAIGSGADAQNASNMIAIGNLAKTSADYAIQLGDGTNSEANTFSVGLDGTNNYKLLGSDGKIPAERLPFEGDVLTNTATGLNSLSTGGATAVSVPRSVALGNAANASAGSAVAVGVNSSASAPAATALGFSAWADGQSSLAVGVQSEATESGSTAVGTSTSSTGTGAVALGGSAKSTATYAIQLGYGTNNEANTFSVGLSNSNNYKLLGSDGKIPAERLPNGILTNTATGNSATAINADDAAGVSSVALGSGASVGQYGAGGTAIGPEATVEAAAGIALGQTSKVTAEYAIQLGYGTNSEAKTLSVGLDEQNNYKLLGIDGKIPAERLPNGILANTAAPEGFSTIPAAPAGPRSVALGSNAQALENNAVAVGYNVQAAQGALAIGLGANAGNTSIALGQAANASTGSGVAIGVSSTVGGGATAVGTASQASAEYSVAIGLGSAASAERAIQIGQGTNSEANTLSVGLSDSNNYKLLGSDGKIPAERLPVARIPVGSATATSYASIWVE